MKIPEPRAIRLGGSRYPAAPLASLSEAELRRLQVDIADELRRRRDDDNPRIVYRCVDVQGTATFGR